ncbi:MAG: hypothetical protein N3D82_01805 [Ignisphaera sp.]|nr:hypothetical protein [Ignisphaera sp.]MCX8167754.1 hypothetical protein [Ignisphaera sp.]MDW8085259.1 transaldolase family protein [Ignisphaera sp.]
MKSLKEDVMDILKRARVESLVLPIEPRIDHADHIIKTALMGWTKLAADHLMHPEMAGCLTDVIGSLIRRIGLLIRSERIDDKPGVEERIIRRARLYDTMFEILFNLAGAESRWAGFSLDMVEQAITAIKNAFDEWEEIERKELGEPAILKAVVELQLRELMKVNKGRSLVADIAQRVMNSVSKSGCARSYIEAMVNEIRNNFYRKAYNLNLCKFGNDYALGLRFLRHLGFVQVSTNPVLAARAYDDDPELWNRFRKYAEEVLVKEHPEWFKDPERYADDITMEATRFALLENFYVFRIPFILSKYHDGLVSYQLNPLIAHDVERSVEAVKIFATRLERDLVVYDEYLWWGYSVAEKGRPDLVIKVAAAYPAAIEIAEKINEMGVGQNITVSYTVSQEVLIGVAAMRGMAKAIKKGIAPTQTYDTNMGGRLEDHLREDISSRLLLRGLEKVDEHRRWVVLDRLAKGLGVKEDVWNEIKRRDLKAVVDYLCSHRVLGRNMVRDPYIDALTDLGVYGSREDTLRNVKMLEEAIELSGTFVAQRVYEILFSPWNREKWVDYLVKEVGVTREQAETVIDRIDLLPASKRKPIDTLYTFASRNVTNTEFPDHQLKVVNEVAEKGIELDEIRESIFQHLDSRYLEILMQYDDFVRAYESSPELNDLLKKVGIDKDYGNRGVSPVDWPKYGSCVKTMNEFTNEYLAFRSKVVDLIKKMKIS